MDNPNGTKKQNPRPFVFPEDFMLEMSEEETLNLRSQFVISSWGGSRYKPFVFTEQEVTMLSSVLRSPTAIQMNIAIMRPFVAVYRLVADSLIAKILLYSEFFRRKASG